jgi:hypothetical protein
LMATDSSGNSRTATYSSLPGGMASFYDFPMDRTLPGVLAARGSPCRLLLWCWGRTRNPSLSH